MQRVFGAGQAAQRPAQPRRALIPSRAQAFILDTEFDLIFLLPVQRDAAQPRYDVIEQMRGGLEPAGMQIELSEFL